MISPKYSRNNQIMNLGIEILRMILCFWVISFHYAGVKNVSKYKILKTFFHVPTFMIISFYFNYKALISNDIIKYKNRMERLLIPYLIWPIIFMIISKFSFNYLKIKQIIILLLHQYLTGFKVMGSLWFVGILIFFGILFRIISCLFRKRALLILQIFSIISYFIQYKEINYKIFFKYSIDLRSGSWVVDMMPIAVTGLTLRKRDIFKNLSNDKIKSIFFSIITLFFIYNYNVFGQFRGFLYSGIKQNIAGICLFISFSLIQFNQIKYRIIIDFIKTITKYTGGIYYLQEICYYILRKFKYLKKNYFTMCFMIYIFGYLICAIFTKLFRSNKFKYLFS